MGKCVICGKPGVTLNVGGKPIAICVACAPLLQQELTDFISSLSAAGALPKRRGRRPRAVTPMISEEEFKQRLAEKVESRGKISVYEFARRHNFGRPDARKIAEELAKEKGYQIEADRKRLILKKPAPAPA